MRRFIIFLLLVSSFLLLPFKTEASSLSIGYTDNSDFYEDIDSSSKGFTNPNTSNQIGIMVLVFFTGFSVTSTLIYHLFLSQDV